MLRAALLAAAIAGAPAAALAHAYLVEAVPVENTTVHAPSELSLRFSQALEKRFSSVEVQGPDGQRADDGKPRAIDTPATLAVGLHKLAAGRYRVIWHATSIDTHRSEGSYYFTVVP